jgi:5-methylcytosine-specific restriction endonuclease McrA
MESGLTPVGVTKRLSNLRAKCLLRDHHRCVITRSFDRDEAESRSDCNDKEAKDDDGYLLENEEVNPMYLEVSHIIPHSLLRKSAGETELVCTTL